MNLNRYRLHSNGEISNNTDVSITVKNVAYVEVYTTSGGTGSSPAIDIVIFGGKN